jgi:hypothetical protein
LGGRKLGHGDRVSGGEARVKIGNWKMENGRGQEAERDFKFEISDLRIDLQLWDEE